MLINSGPINSAPINGRRFVVTVSFTPSVIFDDRGQLFLLVAPSFAIRL
jgi:hypothetical protein